MSTKLDAEALAAKRYDEGYMHMDDRGRCFDITNRMRECAAATIREVAQPIADERDAYREVVENFVKWMNMERRAAPIKEAEAILSKYPKP